MTRTVKERLISALIAVGLGIIFLFIGLQISFNYTDKQCTIHSSEIKTVIDKLDTLINDIDNLPK